MVLNFGDLSGSTMPCGSVVVGCMKFQILCDLSCSVAFFGYTGGLMAQLSYLHGIREPGESPGIGSKHDWASHCSPDGTTVPVRQQAHHRDS